MNVNQDALKIAYDRAKKAGKGIEHSRLDKALTLAENVDCSGVYLNFSDTPDVRELWYHMPGSETPWYLVKTYTRPDGKVTIGGCDCKDHQSRKPLLCKHILAVMLVIRAEEIEKELVKVEPVAALTLTERLADPAYRKAARVMLYGAE